MKHQLEKTYGHGTHRYPRRRRIKAKDFNFWEDRIMYDTTGLFIDKGVLTTGEIETSMREQRKRDQRQKMQVTLHSDDSDFSLTADADERRQLQASAAAKRNPLKRKRNPDWSDPSSSPSPASSGTQPTSLSSQTLRPGQEYAFAGESPEASQERTRQARTRTPPPEAQTGILSLP